jgi:hypothetical protein
VFREFKMLTGISLSLSSCFMKTNKIYTTQNSDIHGYNTIHKRDLYAQFCNTERSKRGVNMGTKILNCIPVQLKN